MSTCLIFKIDQTSNNTFGKLSGFYKKGEFCDIILIVGKNCVKISAHKIVLSAWSEYFSDKFCGKCKIYNESKEIDDEAMRLIIDFMYSGCIELNVKNVESILRTAAFLKMNILVNGCCNFMEQHMNTANSLKWLSLSEEPCLAALKDKCLKHIYNNFEEISKQKELLQLNENVFKDLLANANPREDREVEKCIFLAIVAWIKHENFNRKHLALQLLSKVRFHLLTLEFILKNWSPSGKTAEATEFVWSHMLLAVRSDVSLHTDCPNIDDPPKKIDPNLEDLSSNDSSPNEEDITIRQIELSSCKNDA